MSIELPPCRQESTSLIYPEIWFQFSPAPQNNHSQVRGWAAPRIRWYNRRRFQSGTVIFASFPGFEVSSGAGTPVHHLPSRILHPSHPRRSSRAGVGQSSTSSSYHDLVEFDFWNFGQGPVPGRRRTPRPERLLHLREDMSSVHFLVNEVFMVLFFRHSRQRDNRVGAARRCAQPDSKGHQPADGHLWVACLVRWGFSSLLAIVFYGGSDDFGAVANGWAIPTATDIALAWLVARVIFGNRHPAVNFLLLLAVADDAIGLVIIAVFYSSEVQPLWLLLTAGGMATAYLFRTFWHHLVAGLHPDCWGNELGRARESGG